MLNYTPFYSFPTRFQLSKVKENSSEETVTLVGKNIKISIAFEGQAAALQQFSATLLPALRQGVMRDCDRDAHDAEGGSRRGRPKSTVREDEPRKLVLEEGRSSSDSDDEDLPISHPVRYYCLQFYKNRTRGASATVYSTSGVLCIIEHSSPSPPPPQLPTRILLDTFVYCTRGLLFHEYIVIREGVSRQKRITYQHQVIKRHFLASCDVLLMAKLALQNSDMNSMSPFPFAGTPHSIIKRYRR